MNKFRRDLEKGQRYEMIALNYLDYDSVEFPDGMCKEYDFIITKNGTPTKIEVKSDRLASQTGNLAIEYKCSGKPSGIHATQAEFYIYFINHPNHDECFKIPIEALKELCRTDGKKISGGDNNNSRIYLLSRDIIEKYLVEPIKPVSPRKEGVLPNEGKPLSYTEQLIEHLKKCNLSDIDVITTHINIFRVLYAKQAKKTKPFLNNAKAPKPATPPYDDEKKDDSLVNFGKYKGQPVAKLREDIKYLGWLKAQSWFKESNLYNTLDE